MNTAFSTFTNTADDPVLLDEDDSDDSPVIVRVNEDHQLRRVKKRVNEDNGSSPLSHEGNGSASVVELGTDSTMTSRRGRKRKDTSGEFAGKTVSDGKSDFIILSSDENLKTDTGREGSSMSPPEREKNDSGKKHGRKEEGSSTGRRSRGRVIRTRTSPRTLHETISALDDDQRKAVTDMGLGSLLTMTIQGVPSKLGFFVVDRFDPSSMVIKCNQGVIPITVASIHQVLGLPTGGVDILGESDVDLKSGYPISYWTIGLLKKRESTELDDGGFGRLPLIHRVETRVNNTNTANMKDGVDDGQPDTQEDIAKDLIHLIKKRIEKIKELKVDAESAINKGLTDYPD
ncbi:hypothetical protein L6452_06387 [Arctium lappa]|uniref:Uncharacterized protein n=1 Tax=Arctium lappa TaxID=4217 RepID=A0ACB9EJA2_ARCLA|nr:hypothetical protein L6452_06387 [Arctium lappa]